LRLGRCGEEEEGEENDGEDGWRHGLGREDSSMNGRGGGVFVLT